MKSLTPSKQCFSNFSSLSLFESKDKSSIKNQDLDLEKCGDNSPKSINKNSSNRSSGRSIRDYTGNSAEEDQSVNQELDYKKGSKDVAHSHTDSNKESHKKENSQKIEANSVLNKGTLSLIASEGDEECRMERNESPNFIPIRGRHKTMNSEYCQNRLSCVKDRN